MFYQKTINRVLSELPDSVKSIQDKIAVKDWTEERKRQAISIVSQLEKPSLSQITDLVNDGIEFESIYLKLNKSEREQIANGECEFKAIEEYAEQLVKDINRMLNDIINVKLSIIGYSFTRGICEVEIEWNI